MNHLVKISELLSCGEPYLMSHSTYYSSTLSGDVAAFPMIWYDMIWYGRVFWQHALPAGMANLWPGSRMFKQTFHSEKLFQLRTELVVQKAYLSLKFKYFNFRPVCPVSMSYSGIDSVVGVCIWNVFIPFMTPGKTASSLLWHLIIVWDAEWAQLEF